MYQKELCAGKSAIHGWGAFAKTRHSSGDMVIEYQGEVVRASVADCRERRLYDTLVGAGTYVFTLNSDHQLAVDATRQGQLLPVHLWSAVQYNTLLRAGTYVCIQNTNHQLAVNAMRQGACIFRAVAQPCVHV